jgi:putative membrane protein
MTSPKLRAGPRTVAAALVALLAEATAISSFAQAPSVAPAADKSLSDAEIAGVVLSAAATDISQEELALRNTSSPRIRALAREMVADNLLLDQTTLNLLARLGVQPAPSGESDCLIEKATATTGELASLRGTRFDRAYLTDEVAQDRDLLAQMDGRLMSEAESREVRALLAEIRPVLESHLQRAETMAHAQAG